MGKQSLSEVRGASPLGSPNVKVRSQGSETMRTELAASHDRVVLDRCHTYVESAEVPVTPTLHPSPQIPDYSSVTDEFLNHAITYARDRLNFRRVIPKTATSLRR